MDTNLQDPLISTTSKVEGTASAASITLNLVVLGLGVGVFSLPWTTAGASAIPAVVIIAIVIFVNIWTNSILIECSEKYGAYDLGALTYHLPRPFSTAAMVVTNIAVYAVLLTVLCAYTNIMGGALATAMGAGPMPEVLHCILVTVLILPLCFCNQEYLKFSSAVTVLVTLYIFVLMTMQPKQTQGACVVGIGKGFISMVAVMMQAIVIQMCVLPMYKEMQDRTPRRFNRALQISFTSLLVIYATFAVVGYLTYGPGVNSNILNSLGSDAWGKSGRIAGGFSVVGIYPVLAQSMVAPIWNSESTFRLPIYVLAMIVTVSIPMTISFFHS